MYEQMHRRLNLPNLMYILILKAFVAWLKGVPLNSAARRSMHVPRFLDTKLVRVSPIPVILIRADSKTVSCAIAEWLLITTWPGLHSCGLRRVPSAFAGHPHARFSRSLDAMNLR